MSHSRKRASSSTAQGRFLQIPTLTVGKAVIIRSKQNPQRETSLDFLPACLTPAGFCDYEFISPDGSQCTAVMIRLKKPEDLIQ